MRGVNKVILIGNLTKDPDLRYTVNKRAYARFNIAVNTRRKDPSGEYKESTEYVPVMAWGLTAENCGKYLKKGNAVLIEGRISSSTYDAKDGSGKRFSTEVVIDNLQFIGNIPQSNSNNNSSNNYNNNYSRSQSQSPSSVNNNFIQNDDNFGKSIGESGFDGNSFSRDFNESNLHDTGPDNEIPF